MPGAIQKAEGGRMIDYRRSIRPTRSRLLIAMGVSACLIALLIASLSSLVDSALSVSESGADDGDLLTVRIKKGEHEKSVKITADIEAVRSLPEEPVDSNEVTEIQEKVASVDAPEPPAESGPVKDWRATAEEAAKSSVEEYYRQKESRASMWQQSHSMMFQPTEDTMVTDNEPILSNVQFKFRSRVLGIGMNIGSCFIGIPIAGVPVEQRSAVGISVFVCGKNPG